MIRVCKYCGKEFDAYRRQIYCSEGCRIKANNQKKPAPGVVKTCGFCGKEFVSHHRVKYCSTLCHTRADAERKKAKYIPVEQRKSHKVYPPKPCAECGKMFIPGSGSARYCSVECQAAVKSRRKYKEDNPSVSCADTSPAMGGSSSAARRFYRMSLREVSAECARLHISYGQASLMAQNGTLPEEFGRR